MLFRWIRGVGAIVAVSVCLGACETGPPSQRRLKGLIEDASATSLQDLATLVKTDEWSSVRDQNLTLAFTWTTPHESLCAGLASVPAGAKPPALEILTRPWDRGALLTCLLEEPKDADSLDRLWQGIEQPPDSLTGMASLIWKKYITDIDFQTVDDRIDGTVFFEKPGCFRGRVPFEAHRTAEGWVIDAFTLVGAGVRIDRDDNGRWRESPAVDRRTPPDLEAISTDGFSDVQIFGGEGLRLKHNGEAIDPSALPYAVAGNLVVLRPGFECHFGDVLETLDAIESADPPVTGVFWVTRRMVAGCWCMRSITEPPRPWHGHGDGWISALERMERNRLPRRALQLCVNDGEYRYSNGRSLPIPLKSIRDVIAFGIDDVRIRPDAVFVLSIDPEAPYEIFDEALDAVWATHARRVFVYADRHRGFLFETDPS